MALRNSRGEAVTSDVYKAEVLTSLEARLTRDLRAHESRRADTGSQVVVAVDLLRADELADRMLAALPVVESDNRLAERVGACYDTNGVMALLGRHRSSPVSKQAVDARRRRRSILAMQTSDSHWVYPVFQFRDGDVREDVAAMLSGFRHSPRWSVAAWFQTPAESLDGLSPVEWLEAGRGPEPVADLARDAAGRWAG